MAAKNKKSSESIPANWGMVGHEWAVNLLKHHAAQQTHRNAYLFTGPDGVGRRTLALRFTQAINCPNPVAPGEPCRNCQTCSQIESMLHPDLTLIQADRAGGIIKVDQIRELLHALSLSPYSGKFRIAILIRFEDANQNAANALLKTLEEPPPRVVLILTSESADRLMPTIVSRCELIRLTPVPAGAIIQGLLSGWKISEERAELLAHICDGCPGYAFRLQREPALLDRRYAFLEDQKRLLSAQYVERFDYAEKLAKDKTKARATLAVWLSFWRDVMLTAGKNHIQPINLDWADEIEHLSVQIGLMEAKKLVLSTQRAIDLIDRNINTRLVLEVFMLDLPNSSL